MSTGPDRRLRRAIHSNIEGKAALDQGFRIHPETSSRPEAVQERLLCGLANPAPWASIAIHCKGWTGTMLNSSRNAMRHRTQRDPASAVVFHCGKGEIKVTCETPA